MPATAATPVTVDTDPAIIAERFAADGCLLVRGLYDAETVRELETAFDGIVADLLTSGEKVNAGWKSAAEIDKNTEFEIVHTHQVQSWSAAWARALFDPRLMQVVTPILGNDVILHHTKLFQKPPSVGAPFPMHQDWGYFPTRQDSMIAAIVHVSPATAEMGCVRAYPGSHREGRIASASGRSSDDSAAWQSFTKRYPLDEAPLFEAEPGDVFLFHYFTVHGSGINVSDKTRKTVLFQLMAGTDEVEQPEGHTFSGLVLNGRAHGMTRSRAAKLA